MKTDNSKKQKMRKLILALLILMEIASMMNMKLVESEPGAIPLLLIAFDAGLYIITRGQSSIAAHVASPD